MSLTSLKQSSMGDEKLKGEFITLRSIESVVDFYKEAFAKEER